MLHNYANTLGASSSGAWHLATRTMLLAGILVTLGSTANAGPNEDGTLLLHLESVLLYTTETDDYCGLSTLTSCDDAVVSTSGTSTSVIYVIAAFDSTASPRVLGVTFGIEYDELDITVLDQGSCADFELADAGWPTSGSGTSVTWVGAETGRLTECYWFAAYASYGGPSVLSLTVHPAQGGVFADDSIPATLDEIESFGTLGFGSSGSRACPEDLDETASEGGPPDSDEEAPGWTSRFAGVLPGQLVVRLRSGEVARPESTSDDRRHRRIELADVVARPALLDILAHHGVAALETVCAPWRGQTGRESDRNGMRVPLVDFSEVYRVHFSETSDVAAVANDLMRYEGVEEVVALREIRPNFVPNDLSPDQWHLDNDGSGCTEDTDINMPEAWDIATAAGTKIAIVDSRISLDHEDVGPYVDSTLSRSFQGGDWWAQSGVQTHATQVASVAAAGTNNGIGIAGVANLEQEQVIVSVVGSALVIPSPIVGHADGLAYLASNEVYPQVLVSNHSWGAQRWSSCLEFDDDTMYLRDACRNAYLLDISIVCASGNTYSDNCPECDDSSGECIKFPAGFKDYTLAVAGVDCDGGPIAGYFTGNYIDVAAGGEGILTTASAPDGYRFSTGTSFAAPQAAGVIALLLGSSPYLTNDDCYELLKRTAAPLSANPSEVGAGLLRAESALAEVLPPRAIIHDEVTSYTRISQVGGRHEVVLMNVDVGTVNSAANIAEDFEVDTFLIESDHDITTELDGAVRHVWVRKKFSTGWKPLGDAGWRFDALANANFGVVDWPGAGLATFSTYTYRVYPVGSATAIGWYPFDPNGPFPFRIEYTVVLDASAPASLPPSEDLSEFYLRQQVGGKEGARLEYSVPHAARARILVFDVSGRRVQTIVDREVVAGRHVAVWDGKSLNGRQVAPGVYFARLELDSDGGATATKVVVR